MQFAAKVLGEGSLAMSVNLVKMMMVEVREVRKVTGATNLSLSASPSTTLESFEFSQGQTDSTKQQRE